MRKAGEVQKLWNLETLLHPLPEETFWREYWEKSACVIERGDASYYASLFQIEDVDAVITHTGHASPTHRISLVKSVAGELSVRQVTYTSDGIPNIYPIYRAYQDELFTLVIDRVDLRWNAISRLCGNLENTLCFPIAANLYLTPRGAQGFPPHFDTHDIIVLQLAGSKVWRLYEPAVKLPLHNTPSAVAGMATASPYRTVELDAGDLLYVPRGHIHEAATTDGISLHLTIGVHVFRWSDLITEALNSTADRDIRFREALPTGFFQGQAIDGLRDRLSELLKEFIAGMDCEEARRRLEQRLLSNGQPTPDGHFRSVNELDRLALDTAVTRREGMNCRLLVDDSEARIQFAGNTVVGPKIIEPALRFIAQSKSFMPQDLPDCLSDDNKVALVHRLVREGLIRIG